MRGIVFKGASFEEDEASYIKLHNLLFEKEVKFDKPALGIGNANNTAWGRMFNMQGDLLHSIVFLNTTEIKKYENIERDFSKSKRNLYSKMYNLAGPFISAYFHEIGHILHYVLDPEQFDELEDKKQNTMKAIGKNKPAFVQAIYRNSSIEQMADQLGAELFFELYEEGIIKIKPQHNLFKLGKNI